MFVQVAINIQPDDDWEFSPDEAAEAILTALNGNAEKDIVQVNVNGTGRAGVVPPPPSMTPINGG